MQATSIVQPNGNQVYTGRVKPKSRPQTLHLRNYLNVADANLPTSVDYLSGAIDGIKRFYLNDRMGDCVIADCGHALNIWSARSGKLVVPTDAEIAAAYNRLKAGPGDSGCVITQVLDAWTVGIVLGGKLRQIAGYVAVDWRSKPLIQAAILIFGGVRFGVDLPAAWANTADGATLPLTRSKLIGGHDWRAVSYNEQGIIIATWAGTRLMPWNVLTTAPQIDEAYVELSPDWFDLNGKAPNGLDIGSLSADLKRLSNGTLPEIVAAPDPFDFSGFA